MEQLSPALLVGITNLPPLLVPFLIFFARIIDVSIGTLRIILVSRGKRSIATLLSFFEILIWLLAISQIIANLTDWYNYIAYACGFATGTWVGMTLERRVISGLRLVRVIVPHEGADLVMYLIAQNYRVTWFDAQGALGPVKIIFTIVPRSVVRDVVTTITRFDPAAFYSIEDVRMVSEKALLDNSATSWKDAMALFGLARKGK